MEAKYLPYPEYKDSGDGLIGNMPSHWMLSRVKHIGKVIGGYAFKSRDFIESGIGAIKISNVSHLTFDWADSSYLPLRFLDEQSEYIPPNGSLIFAMTRPIISGGVKVAKFEGEGQFLVNQRVGFLKPSKKVNQDFLMYVTQSESFYCAFKNNITTTNQPNISSEGIEDIRFICPSIVEQEKIANFLDHEIAKIDTLIEKQQQLIKLLKEKRQAVISHAVTKGLPSPTGRNAPMRYSGVDWLGEVPEHWKTMPLKLVVKTRKGVAFKSTDFCDVGVRVVKASDIKSKTLRATDVFLPEPFRNAYPKAVLSTGDIILSTVGSNPDVKNSAVGQIGMVPEGFSGTLLNQNTVVFDSDENEVLGEYLFYILQMQGYRDHLDLHAHGTANQSSLNVADMLNFHICFPPVEDQRYICKYIKRQLIKLDKLEINTVGSEVLLKERRTALISAAVTGKIDVRDFEAKDGEAA